MAPISYPILVISYSDESREALAASLRQLQVAAVSCANFEEAETLALQGIYNGLLVDLTSIIKAKGEEKIIAYSLTGFYPTLRVRTLGSMLVPMIMPGGAKQDSNLNDFLSKTCAAFSPRKLRSHRRHEVCLAAVLRRDGEERCFVRNLSWGGAFLVQMHPERFTVGEELRLFFPDFDLEARLLVRWIQPWGGRRVPGIGGAFVAVEGELSKMLAGILKTDRSSDRDRLVA